MKPEKKLKILHNIKKACDEMVECGYNYQEYETAHPIAFDIKEKQKIFQIWYSSVSDVLESIMVSKGIFSNHIDLWNDIQTFTENKVIPPTNLQFQITDKLSLRDVIRIARNHKAHPDKINQENYLLLAEYIPHQTLMQLAYKMSILVLSEIKSLSIREKEIMIGESLETKRRIIAMQETLRKFIPVLEATEHFTPEMKENFYNFLSFIPSKENVKIDHTLDNKN